jgi:hypothetical protein
LHKTKEISNQKGELFGYVIDCPACGYPHVFETGRWTFNGDYGRPTFRPSMLVNANMPQLGPRCHSFVTDGKIQFLSDCTHSMAGKTVELPDIDS